MGASGPAVRGKKRTLAEAEEAGGAGAQELNADSIDIQNNISELHSEVRNILVDMSSWLVPLCNSSITFAQKFCLEPKVSLHAEIHELVGSRISYFENLGRRLIFVFGNARNVLKQQTNKLFDAKLLPLNPFSATDAVWNDLLGFSVEDSIYKVFDDKNVARPHHKHLCTGEYYARSGSKMKDLALHRPKNNKGEDISWGSRLYQKPNSKITRFYTSTLDRDSRYPNH